MQVPHGSIPGVSRVAVLRDGKVYATELPKDATYPHSIRVTFEDGKLTCQAQKRACNSMRALVPGDAIPGISNTHARGDSLVEVKVPQDAKPGDTLVLNTDRKDTSKVHSLRFPMGAPPVAPFEDLQRHLRLQQVLKENGGTWNPKIERASTDRLIVPGIVATESISKGEVLVRCPPHLLLSSQAVRQMAPAYAVIAAEAANELIFDRGNVDIALQATFIASLVAASEDPSTRGPTILHEGKRVVWEAFLKVLRCETFAQHPYRLAAQDPVAFKSSLLPSCEADLIEYLAWTVVQWYDIVTSCSSAYEAPLFFSPEQFLRAWLLVTTRAFDVDGTCTTLVPGLDSFNHDPLRASARAAPDGTGGMLIAATRDIESGEEIFLLYQKFSNSELYRKYGFTLPEASRHEIFENRSRGFFVLILAVTFLSIDSTSMNMHKTECNCC